MGMLCYKISTWYIKGTAINRDWNPGVEILCYKQQNADVSYGKLGETITLSCFEAASHTRPYIQHTGYQLRIQPWKSLVHIIIKVSLVTIIKDMKIFR